MRNTWKFLGGICAFLVAFAAYCVQLSENHIIAMGHKVESFQEGGNFERNI